MNGKKKMRGSPPPTPNGGGLVLPPARGGAPPGACISGGAGRAGGGTRGASRCRCWSGASSVVVATAEPLLPLAGPGRHLAAKKARGEPSA